MLATGLIKPSIAWLAERFGRICGAANVSSEGEEIHLYGQDQTMDLHFPFDILVKPGSPQEIAEILGVCNQYHLPVTPRGGGSGVTGGALPVNRGVVMSTERLNKILAIDKTDLFAIVEAGVVTADLCQALADQELFLPVVPGSAAWSFVGGNVAENAGSMASCKYGTTERYVLNLEVVLPTGEILWTGSNVQKDVSGLNLTSLFCGSEGILGIITKVVYRVLPRPAVERMLLAGFGDLNRAYDAIMAIRSSGLRPSAVELIGEKAIGLTAAWLGEKLPLVKEGIRAHLLVAFEEESDPIIEKAAVLLSRHTEEDILLGETTLEKEKLTRLRANIGHAMVFQDRMYRDIDSTVPLSRLPEYVENATSICRSHDLELVWFGHALDGNLHTMILADRQLPGGRLRLDNAAREIYACAIGLGGVLSGEHGIGLLQREFMEMQFTTVQLELMRKIKQLLDPAGILNPGKKI
jgi:glycolate oxidase